MAHDSSYHCAKTLRFLKWFETHWKLEVPVKDIMQTVKWKINVLQSFFIHKRKWHIEDKNLQLHLCHIDKVVYDTTQNFILSKGKCWTFQEKMCLKISSVIEKLDMTKPHIRQVYAIISKSSRSTCSEVGDMIELLQVLLKNYFSRRAHSNFPLTKERQALEENLRYLKIFLELAKTWCCRHEILKGLLTHAEAVTDSAACLLYLCCEESEMDDNTVNEMKDEISCLGQKVKPFQPNVREIYIKALKALESSLQDIILVEQPVLHFLYTLLGHMIELSNVKARFKRSVMDQIEALHEELQIISCYLFDPSASQYTQKIKKVRHLLLHIKIVLCRAAYAIYASYDSDIPEEMAGHLNLRIADLPARDRRYQDKIEIHLY